MFDHKPQERLVKIAAEAPPEPFETRVLRELTAIGERLAKLETEMAATRLLSALVWKQMPYLPEPSPWPYQPRPFEVICDRPDAPIGTTDVVDAEWARLHRMSGIAAGESHDR
jgi:hypothetical protein